MSNDALMIGLTAVFILLNAFFVLAEFSLIKLRSSRLEEMVKTGDRRALLVKKAHDNLNGYLASVQLGITMASLLIGWIGEPAVSHLIHGFLPAFDPVAHPALAHGISFALSFAFITSMHTVFGEQAPKLFAIQFAEKVALACIYPLTAFYYVSFGPMWLLDKTATGVARILGYRGNGEEPLHSDDEIKIILDRREEAGKLSLDRLMMFENLFDFGNTKVREVMTPAAKVVHLSFDATDEANLETIRTNKYTRFPVCASCSQGLRSLAGYIHLKEITRDLIAQKTPDISARMKPLPSISGDESLEECLARFQDKRWCIASVIGEDGFAEGIITIEDIVEEIVGEIRDEFDEVPPIVLSKALSMAAVNIGLKKQGKFDIIDHLVSSLHAAHPHFDRIETGKAVVAREKSLATAIGQEAAIPHARIAGIRGPMIAFATVPTGVDWGAPDGQPVKLVFLILTPISMPSVQVTVLSHLARLLTTPTLRDRLVEAQNADDVIEAMKASEEKVPD